jgi:membrane peptidoglycan carboxypeptidase
MRWLSWHRAVVGSVSLAGVAAGVWAIGEELRTSAVQARTLSRLAGEMTFAVAEGPSLQSQFPDAGPYNERLGYARMPEFLSRLTGDGYVIASQARLSDRHLAFMDYGGFALFREKAQTGLTIRDRSGEAVFVARHPEHVFPDFPSVPPLVVNTLLFVENRELLDDRFPNRNPAVEWDRFAAATVNVLTAPIDPSGKRFGGSTLATQIEKYRHSPEGRTIGVSEKLRQIASASLRSYMEGPDTSAARRQIVVDYLNSTPLSARPGFGEVIGLGDGLWAWYGTSLATASRLLSSPPRTAQERIQRAQVYKQVLSLLLAQRRPSYYLLEGRNALADITDSHLRLLAQAGVIDAQLRDDAAASTLTFRVDPPQAADISFIDRKAVNAIRSHLLSMLGLSAYYQLDRLDLTVDTSLDTETQRRVTNMLRRIGDPAEARALGLTGERLLERGDPANVAYSITLYERVQNANLLRLQADNLDRPLDLNEGGKMDLGSTAKLRTLVSYLSVIAELHERYGSLSREELREAATDAEDNLTRWALSYLVGTGDRSLQAMLNAAMDRKYSASPNEGFFTGGGMHTFANFDKNHNGRIMPVWEAFRFSVNLVFIRMMRDIAKYYIAEGPEPGREILTNADHPARREYLEQFADKEGTVFLNRFYSRYRGKTPDEALALLASRSRPTPHRLATVFRSVRPNADLAEFKAFMKRRLPDSPLDEASLAKLYRTYGVDRFSLQDRGYIARIHPLELWLVAYLQQNPETTRSQMLAASVDERQEAYNWLFKSKRKRAADTRIRILLEEEAFKRIHAGWQKLGYPFASLVPSYATAIGTSADRPQALAELMGIIVNDGVKLPSVRIESLHFAEGTPYETRLVHDGAAPERVLPAEVAATAQRALTDVVENGTARRLRGAIAGAHGAPLPIGGKTGTGDELADSRGVSFAGKDVSRSAAFVFFIGDRFFGTITAHVPGAHVRKYKFTSALPVQVLKVLAPAIEPLLAPEQGRGRPSEQGKALAEAKPTVQ